MAKESVIRRDVFVAAKPAAVFAYLVEPDKMRRWMGVTHTLDPRPGGVYRVDVTNGNIAAGKYTEVVPGKRVAFTWGWEKGDSLPPGASTVTIDLVPEGQGTRVTLTHSGLPSGMIKQHTEGWIHYLDRLGVAAAGGDAGPDPWAKKEMAAKPPAKKPAAKKPVTGKR